MRLPETVAEWALLIVLHLILIGGLAFYGFKIWMILTGQAEFTFVL